MTRSRSIALAITVVAVTSLVACASSRAILAIPAHYTSHELCSAVFVGRQMPERVFARSIAPELGWASLLLSYRVDAGAGTVTARFAGGPESRARFVPGAGCRIVSAGEASAPLIATDRQAVPGPAVEPPAGSPLAGALDRAFEERPSPPFRNTVAVAVWHEGKIIAERYAPGYDASTPILGWSMTKSVVNALVGALVQQGRIDVAAPVDVPEWQGADDERRAITIDQLLRMTSGLDLGQSLRPGIASLFDPSIRMTYVEDDMAAFAVRAALVERPGAVWAYADGNTQILTRLLQQRLGGEPGALLAFAKRTLFDPLGMTGVTWESDATGTPLGAAHMWATARDWLRLGQLYLDDGRIGTTRILPPGWADYSARQTPGSEWAGYGAGFWTDRGGGSGADYRVAAGMPRDAFMARGHQGQYIVIIPSARLVVVRMGMAFDAREDVDGVSRLVRDVIETLGGA